MFPLKLFGAVLACAMLPAAGAERPFLSASSKQEACAGLDRWLSYVQGNAGGADLDYVVMEKVRALAAPAFKDAVFAQVIGKAYDQLSGSDRDRIRDGLKSCYRDGAVWKRNVMAEPFDRRTPPFALQEWITAIAAARGTAPPPDLVAGRMPSGRHAANTPPEMTIPRMGIIVSPSKQIAFDRVNDAVKVVAVQRDGPAFAAGIKPGDVIGTTDRNTRPTPDSLASLAARMETGSRVDFGIVGNARGSQAHVWFSVGVMSPQAGEWIRSESEPILARRPELLAEAARRHEAARAGALEAVQKGDPCSVSDSQLQMLASEALKWAVSANRTDNSLVFDLRQAAMRACSVQRSGGLPAFEARIFAITGGAVQACDYTKNAAYASIENAVRQQTSREDYEGLIEARISHYLRGATSQARSCFFRILADF